MRERGGTRKIKCGGPSEGGLHPHFVGGWTTCKRLRERLGGGGWDGS